MVLCYPCYLFAYISPHISSQQFIFNKRLSLSQTSNTLSGPPQPPPPPPLKKKKSSRQSPHSTRLLSFYPATEVPYSGPSDHITLNHCIPQKLLKAQQQSLCPTYHPKWTSNIPFTGWIGNLTAMSDSCSPKLDGEMLPSRSGIYPKQLNMKMLIFLWPFLATVVVSVLYGPSRL